jgi:hypothetical protein
MSIIKQSEKGGEIAIKSQKQKKGEKMKIKQTRKDKTKLVMMILV